MKESHLKHIAVDMNYLDNIELDLLKKKTPVQPPLTENERKRLEKYELTTCFLKTQQGIVEVPFANVMELILFARIIPLAQVRSGYPKSKRLRDILVESHLKVLNDKVYIDTDHL